jgi:hypothetical protein
MSNIDEKLASIPTSPLLAERMTKEQPSRESDTEITRCSNDTISRQAAIDIERNATVDTNPSHFEAHQKFTQFMDDAEVSSFGRWQWSNGFNTALTAVGIDLKKLPSVQPERTCVNCGRTANNGGWYADGRTRCPIEEHYALPKDGYCHLWEKRNVTDDDYPERREE